MADSSFADGARRHQLLSPEAADLLLRETNHRCANDLQLVVSLLALQSRKATNAETRAALTDAMERVSILARARAALLRRHDAPLETALRETCEALDAQARPRSILVSATFEDCPKGLSSAQVTAITLAVNELATNAIKHAFAEGKSGRIDISVEGDAQFAVVMVDDDGLPFPDDFSGRSDGLGLGLVSRLIGSVGGSVINPAPGTKVFRLLVPAANASAQAN